MVVVGAVAGWDRDAGAAEPIVAPSTLSPTVGSPVALDLNLPAAPGRARPGWDTANVAQAFVRTGGQQETLLPMLTATPGQRAQFNPQAPGHLLLCFGLGPPDSRGHADSWQRVTHCTKIVLTVRSQKADPAEKLPPNPGITAKTGQKIEILPLIDPTGLRKGDHLPVRVYYEGVKVAGGRVSATVVPLAAPGTVLEVAAARPTDAQGTTWLPITRAGRWRVRFVHQVEGEPEGGSRPRRYVAELIFEVPDGGRP
ncbi:MAG: DUF4198 domain-containing protein [Planctomycetes bacterium]|nr:DUF4198 domain-containing protein [Planctomycetota bacterium]